MTKIKDTKLNNSHGRLRFIRSISGLTRNEIEEKYGLNLNEYMSFLDD